MKNLRANALGILSTLLLAHLRLRRPGSNGDVRRGSEAWRLAADGRVFWISPYGQRHQQRSVSAPAAWRVGDSVRGRRWYTWSLFNASRAVSSHPFETLQYSTTWYSGAALLARGGCGTVPAYTLRVWLAPLAGGMAAPGGSAAAYLAPERERGGRGGD